MSNEQQGLPRKDSDYKEKTIEETLKQLEVSEEGLSESEAQNRIKKYGYNEVSEKKVNPLLSFLKRYWGPMPWLLEFAAIL